MASDWKIVRVFISSTFLDMQAERDQLVRFTFPRLREKLLDRHIHLVEVDLRWGVTSDTNSVEACRDIIDECRPRFLCMLGGRYGYVPPGHTRSITAEEIDYSIRDNYSDRTHRIFYFRDPKVTETMPSSFRESHGSDAAQKLDDLKQTIVQAGFSPKIYFARWDQQLGHLTDLNDFGKCVFADLLASIDAEFGPKPTTVFEEADQERLAMEAFIERHAANYIVGSRREVLDQLHEIAQAHKGERDLLIKGPPGSGKSALLAKFASELRQRDLSVGTVKSDLIYHAVGASVRSSNTMGMLRRIAYELESLRGDGPETSTTRVPADENGFSTYFSNFGTNHNSNNPSDFRPHTILIVVDGLNQLGRPEDVESIIGLLQRLPHFVRLIFSVTGDDEKPFDDLGNRHSSVLVSMRTISLSPLAPEDRDSVVRTFLARFRKRMTDQQISLLLAKRDTGKPLYLVVALEELRTFGLFSELNDRIRDMPEEVGPLFQSIIARLEEDPGFVDDQGCKVGPRIVRDFARLLAVSRFGLSTRELVDLAEPGDPFGHIAALERLLRPYLIQRGELLDFFHFQLKQAALARYLSDKDLVAHAHATLADYFRVKADPQGDGSWTGEARSLNEVVPHLIAADRLTEVKQILSSLRFIAMRARFGQLQDLLNDYRFALDHIDEASTPADEFNLNEWRLFVRRHLGLLSAHPEQTYQAAFNQGRSGPVPEAAAVYYRQRQTQSGWLECRNRPDDASAALVTQFSIGTEVIGLHATEHGDEALAIANGGRVFALNLSNGAISRHQVPVDQKVILASGDLRFVVISIGRHELRLVDRSSRDVLWQKIFDHEIMDVAADLTCQRIMFIDEHGESIIYDTASDHIIDRRHALDGVLIGKHFFNELQQYPAIAKLCRLSCNGQRAAALGGIDYNWSMTMMGAHDSLGAAAIWTVGSAKESRIVRGFARDIQHACFSWRGDILLAAANGIRNGVDERRVIAWNCDSGERCADWDWPNPVVDIAFASDKDLVAVPSRDAVGWANVATGERLAFGGLVSPREPDIKFLRLNREGTSGVYADTAGNIKGFDVAEIIDQSGKHTASIRCLSLAPDASLLLSGADDGRTVVWNDNYFEKDVSCRTGCPVRHVQVLPGGDGYMFASTESHFNLIEKSRSELGGDSFGAPWRIGKLTGEVSAFYVLQRRNTAIIASGIYDIMGGSSAEGFSNRLNDTQAIFRSGRKPSPPHRVGGRPTKNDGIVWSNKVHRLDWSSPFSAETLSAATLFEQFPRFGRNTVSLDERYIVGSFVDEMIRVINIDSGEILSEAEGQFEALFSDGTVALCRLAANREMLSFVKLPSLARIADIGSWSNIRSVHSACGGSRLLISEPETTHLVESFSGRIMATFKGDFLYASENEQWFAMLRDRNNLVLTDVIDLKDFAEISFQHPISAIAGASCSNVFGVGFDNADLKIFEIRDHKILPIITRVEQHEISSPPSKGTAHCPLCRYEGASQCDFDVPDLRDIAASPMFGSSIWDQEQTIMHAPSFSKPLGHIVECPNGHLLQLSPFVQIRDI